MTGTCDVNPNQCVLGIFAANPQAGNGFAYPHLFSAPFNVTVGDGLDLGDNPGDGSAPALTMTSATNSTVVASSATVAADGLNTSRITVTLKDTNDHPVTTAKSVTLSQGSGHSTIEVNGTAGSTATTDGSGQAVFTVSDTVAETVTYSATDTSDSPHVTPTQTPAVTYAAPVATASNSSITALSTAVPQGGNTTVTVTLKDQGVSPQPISGKLITLTAGSGSSVIVPATSGSATTNTQGQAIVHRLGRDGADRDLLRDGYDRRRRPDRPERQYHVRDTHRLGDRLHRDDDDTDRGHGGQQRSGADGNRHRHAARRHQSRLGQDRHAELLVHDVRHHARLADNWKRRPGILHRERPGRRASHVPCG